MSLRSIHDRSRWGLAACLALAFTLAIAPSAKAQTPDGETPATEDICTAAGFTGKVYGLCNAYCEAMDCDSAEPQASEQACTRVFEKIMAAGGGDFPPCADEDGDGVANGIDNCPFDDNPLQADSNANGVGDVCDCPCLGVGGVPNTTALLQSDADQFANLHADTRIDEGCEDGGGPRPNLETFVRYLIQHEGTGSPNAPGWQLTASCPFITQQPPCAGRCRFGRVGEGSTTPTWSAQQSPVTEPQLVSCEETVRALQAADPLDVCPD